MKRLNKYTYHQKLIFVLSAFILLLCIPYTLFLYDSSKERIVNTIKNANDQNLQQVKYSYSTFNDMIENLCFSVYLDTDSQLLMYSPNVTTAEAVQKMQQFRTTFLNIYPSVHSISIYNGTQHEFYSTLPERENYFINLSTYIENTPDVPILQPVLREIPYGEKGVPIYVFSYFLYDYTFKDGTPRGYIVVDQYASWLLDNFSELRSSNAKIPSRIYLLDNNGNICSPISSSIDEALLKELSVSQISFSDSSDSLSHTISMDGEKYLVTSLLLKEGGSSLIMIQDYKDVFADFQTFQRTFLIVFVIWCVLFIVAILTASKSLYKPIRKTLDYVSSLSGSSFQHHQENEFSHLMTVYKDSQEKLRKQTQTSGQLIKQYQLEKLLTDSSPSIWKKFAASFPDHWLTKESCSFRVVRITPGSHTRNGNPLSDEDFQLSLFIIQNILSEMLSANHLAEIFISSSDSAVSGIVQSSQTENDPVLEKILKEATDYIQKNMNLSCQATYSSTEKDPAKLSFLYSEVLMLHNYHYVFGPDTILNPDSCITNMQNENEIIPENLEKKCLYELKCDHLEEALKALEQIFDQLIHMKRENITVCLMSFVNHINYTLKELYHARGALAQLKPELIYHQVISCEYLADVYTHLSSYLTNSMKPFLEQEPQDKSQIFVQDIQDYIAAHYSDPNLSSQTIGEYMNLTAKYVMKKFQASAGLSINDYIYEVRMQQAAILLTECDLPINKVAEQVGILNENYFYRLFKKKYGCTPRKYSSQNREA